MGLAKECQGWIVHGLSGSRAGDRRSPYPKLGRTTFCQDAGNRQSLVLGPLLARNGEPEGPRGPDQASVERKKANLAVEPAQHALGLSG